MAVADADGARAIRNGVQALCDHCAAHALIAWSDRVWAYNTVLDCLGLTYPAPDASWPCAEQPCGEGAKFDLEATLALLADAAIQAGAIEDTLDARDRMGMRVMGALMPRPSDVIAAFRDRMDAGEPSAATDWFYRLCCDAGYVREAAIAKNIRWTCPTRWGELEMTINLSKPEKDPREIALAGSRPSTDEAYPACQLCIENEGFPGRGANEGKAHPARQNLRIVPITLNGERWGLQYSPYAYFNEHCIAMSAQHRPMHIDRATLTCLLDFVDMFPRYFIGSNADLPIVGGSILSHDHFQGGAHEFPMMKVGVASSFTLARFPHVDGAVLTWPLTVLRLRCADRAEVLNAAVHVIDAWRAWSDEAAGIVARDADGTPHNTVTPIVRRVDADGHTGGDLHEVCLALRCNITSTEHPLGVFHPHAERHHIKRENIGLIEVMGLAILPPRLKREMAAVEELLLRCVSIGGATDGEDALRASDGDFEAVSRELLCALEGGDATHNHAAWAVDVFARRFAEIEPETVHGIVLEEVGLVFSHVLEDAGVFKWDAEGRAAQQRFIDSL